MFIYKRDGVTYEWSGGAYIEIFPNGSASPVDVYNVWDYALDVPTIERSSHALAKFVNEMIEEEMSE